MADAAAVVRDYLQGRNARDGQDKARAVVRAATAEIVGELPDGFTAKDVRECVKTLLDGNSDTAELTTNARGRAVTTTLNNLVSDGKLTLDDKAYSHADPTTATAGDPRVPSVPVGL